MSTTTDIGGGLKKVRRSVSAYLNMPHGGEYTLTLYREVVLLDANGKVMGRARDDNPLQESVNKIAQRKVDYKGKVYDGAMVMELLAKFFDQVDDEREARQTAAP